MNRPRRVSRSLVNYRSAEEYVPAEHPLRPLKSVVTRVLDDLRDDMDGYFSRIGQPTIAPEKILRAVLLQALYSIRDEQFFLEQLGYNLLFRWFVGMSLDDRLWDIFSFTKNRDALISSELAATFFSRVQEEADRQGLLSDRRFTIDASLVPSWASR